MRKAYKIIGAIFLGIAAFALLCYVLGAPSKDISWGLNYSTVRAKDLGLNPEQLFATIIKELQPKQIRLPIYWEEIEPVQGRFDFALYDRMLSIADQRNIKIIAVVGHKLPRWPECHHPDWYINQPVEQQAPAVLNMVGQTVTHLKAHPSIKAWQVENEPLFPYGPDCPVVSRHSLKEEIAVVRELDSRPIIGTDSGEKGAWLPTAWGGVDILGSTMYREVYYDKLVKYVTYPLPSWTYNVKAGLVRLFSGTNRTIGVELQAEPWFAGKGAQATPLAEQAQHMNPTILQNNIGYARRAGFAENYLWGVEWWYWLAGQGDDSMVQAGKTLFTK